jgi:hypothetical protein
MHYNARSLALFPGKCLSKMTRDKISSERTTLNNLITFRNVHREIWRAMTALLVDNQTKS